MRKKEGGLRHQPAFVRLWMSQSVSSLGGSASGVAVPLLVLQLTGSPAALGVVAFIGALPLFIFTLPGGVLVDRWNRLYTLIACDVIRVLALVSLIAVWAVGGLGVVQIAIVAFVETGASVLFSIAERSAVALVVPAELIPDALASNQSREYVARLGGPPAGGALFGVSPIAPFIADLVSYVWSVALLRGIQIPFQEAERPPRRHMTVEMKEGIAWVWRNQVLRATIMLAGASSFVVNSLLIVVIVVAREDGASAAEIGLVLGIAGIGGIAGAAMAPRIVRQVSAKVVLRASLLLQTLLTVAFLGVLRAPLGMACLYGAIFLVAPAWNAVAGTYRATTVPDNLRGRIQGVSTLVTLGAIPFGRLILGAVLADFGPSVAVTVLVSIGAAATIFAGVDRGVRDAPSLSLKARAPKAAETVADAPSAG